MSGGGEPPVTPASPRLSQLTPATWWGVLVRSVRGFRRDRCLDFAASLTYWSLLAMFPALVMVVALVGLVATGQAAVDAIVETVAELAPAQAAGAIETRIREVTEQRSGTGALLSVGAIGALWTASAYLRSFTRAANAVHEVVESRPAYRLVPLQLALTVLGLLIASVVVAALVVSGPVARAVGSAIGAGDLAVATWEVVKWPVLLVLALVLLSLLFWVAPDVPRPRLRWLAVGGLATVVIAAVASAGFGIYVANLGTYDVTYGALGAVIVFLVWLFLVNCAVLLGVEINAELQRGRRLQAAEG